MKPHTLVSFSFYSSCLWLLFASSLCRLCSCNQNSDHVHCIATERVALIQFKNSLVDRDNRLSSWSGDDCCSWSGVVCDNFTHHVHELRLRGPDDGLHGHCHGYYDTNDEFEKARKEMLGGIISPSLIKLEQLRHLDLSCNDFGLTPIPAFIGSLQNLRYLNLSKSQFAGEIPHQLGNLSELLILDVHDINPDFSYLHVDNIQSENLKWIENMKGLQYLDMGGINLARASDWLQVINTLPSLQQLYFPSCLLTRFPTEPTRVNFTSLIVLDLSSNLFTNLLPGWIFSLHNLVSLDLTGCSIGALSPGTHGGFDSMPSLRTLRLSHNSFVNSPSILKGLPSLSNLGLLDVSFCNLSDPILGNLQNLSQIVHLNLSSNQIVEEIPSSLSSLCNLTTLDLESNHFSGNVSELLERFCECESPKLEFLSLNSNYLIGRLPEKLGRLKNLIQIDIAYNGLTGILPRSLGSLSLLKKLWLYRNQFEGSIPDSIGDLSSLKDLDLSYNKLNGSLPESMGKLRKLNSLILHYNSLAGTVTENHFANLTTLKSLWAGGNKLAFDLVKNWIPPFQLYELSLGSFNLGPLFPSWVQSQTKLFALDLSNANISGTIPDFWMNLEFLQTLNLENNKLCGKIPSSLGNSFSLKILHMRNNKLSGDLPVSLLISQNLMIVDLAENELTGRIRIPMSIGGNTDHYTRLKVLSLRSNKLEGEIPIEMCHLINSIQILDIANNSFSGYLPTCFTNFTVISGKEEPTLSFPDAFSVRYHDTRNISLVIKGHVSLYSTILNLVTALDFSNNNFSGSIPNELVALSGLRYLNLSQNKLTGFLPDTFREMRELESLDLSVNNLDGKIPLSLAGLTALSWLNVSYNNLTGTIPTGRQFQTFNEFSFIGNALCGAPLPGCQKNSDDTTRNDDEPDGTDWILVICMIVGLAVGFWITIGTLIVNKQWRDAYYRFLDEMRIKLANYFLLVSIFGMRIIHTGRQIIHRGSC